MNPSARPAALLPTPDTPDDFELVVGMELHAQLLTRSKLFCACPNRFGDPPNQNTCPVCLGHPGTLPVVNREAVGLLVKAALALNCTLHELSRFARKNYFYPDLPKGYQISQYEAPLATAGWLDVRDGAGGTRRIRIRRIHLEEDAGKLLHEGRDTTAVDLNRAGTPLMEIVTEPDFRSLDDIYDYLVQLRQILRYLGVCDGNMEEGSLRCEPNISLRPRGSEGLGVKVELKNINSFKAARRGVEHELRRQQSLLLHGQKVRQETRGWDEDRGESFLMRSKEEAEDYRYFPDPDLPPLRVEAAWAARLRAGLGELPRPLQARLCEQYGLGMADAEVLCAELELARYYETVARGCGDGKAAANWVMGEVLRVQKAQNLALARFPVEPDRLAALVAMVGAGTLSGTLAKKVFELMQTDPAAPAELVAKHDLGMVADEAPIREVVALVMNAHPGPVAEVLAGKEKTIGFLVGQCMRRLGGKADPQTLNRVLRAELEARRAGG